MCMKAHQREARMCVVFVSVLLQRTPFSRRPEHSPRRGTRPVKKVRSGFATARVARQNHSEWGALRGAVLRNKIK